MIDNLGRNIDYIRISLTDRCNLRCVYCMPEEGVALTSHNEILSYEEIERICRVMAGAGLKKIKLTGGEPLIRRNLSGLLKTLKQIPGIECVTLTTNGILLKDQLQKLYEAGLDGVNISLDTRDPVKYQKITRGDHLKEVLEGIDEALKYPGIVTKINCVPIDEDEKNLIDMAALARDHRLHVRFIEVMPLGQGKQYSAWTQEKILKVLENVYGPASLVKTPLGNGPACYYTFEGFQGKIGLISAVSHKFCEKCNRLRLTSVGYLKACLQYQLGVDLKGPLRNGCSDEEILELLAKVLAQKPAGHQFFEDKTGPEEALLMAQIGG